MSELKGSKGLSQCRCRGKVPLAKTTEFKNLEAGEYFEEEEALRLIGYQEQRRVEGDEVLQTITEESHW